MLVTHHRGFSLIELMFTITLMGILLALGLPSLAAWIKNSQVRTVAESLQTGLRTAQAEALRRNHLVVLSFTNATPALNATAVAGGKNWSIQTIPQGAETTAEFIQGGQLTDVASNVSIGATPTGTTAVCFNSNGRVVANSGAGCTTPSTSIPFTFTVSQTGADRTLWVLLQVGGQLRMCDPNRPSLSATSPDGCPAS